MSRLSLAEQRQALARLIEGKSDEEILATVHAGTADALLRQLFHAMAEAFLPERAAATEAVIQFNIKLRDQTRSYQLKVSGGACQADEGSPEDPRVILTLGLPDLLRLVCKQVSGPQLFAAGRLAIQRDMTTAIALQGWLQS